MEPCDQGAVELLSSMAERAISPLELMDSCLARIRSVNPAVNAVVTLDEEGALAKAKQAEAAIMRGETLPPLHGLPVLIKDTQDTAGLRTTYGSPLFAQHVPTADQGSVARLRAAGAIIFGKTNTPEWAAGGNTRNPVHGATGNPFDPMKSAAGSSGGSAVALACGMTPLASGSDTGGSLRNPAGFSGIVGMRPSYGLVASEKRLQGWSSLSTDGPMARNVADTALMLSVMASDDARDPLAYTLPGELIRGRSPSPRILVSLRPSRRSGAPSASGSRASRRWSQRRLQAHRIARAPMTPLRCCARRCFWRLTARPIVSGPTCSVPMYGPMSRRGCPIN